MIIDGSKVQGHKDNQEIFSVPPSFYYSNTAPPSAIFFLMETYTKIKH